MLLTPVWKAYAEKHPKAKLSSERRALIQRRLKDYSADLLIDGADALHLPRAGHMLPMTHASIVNPEIAKHIVRADELAELPLAFSEGVAEAMGLVRD